MKSLLKNPRLSLLTLLMLVVQANVVWSCKKSETPVVPDITSENLLIGEGNVGTKIISLVFYLSETTSVPVSFNWQTLDETAKAGDDYVAASGTVTFAPGEKSKAMELTILSDTNLELDEYFWVKLSDAQNGTLRQTSIKVTLGNDDTYTAQKVQDGYITPDTYPGMTRLWSDEFNGTALNTSDWNYEIGAGGWGNEEWQTYTTFPENSFVQDGFLTIRATKSGNSYYSARLTTKGKQAFTYGRIDIRAKMPQGKGIWPALWMLGSNISSVGWPSCGEIDIMEYLGHDLYTVYGTAHYNDGGHQYKGGSYKVTGDDNFASIFHVFTIIWQENSIDWYVDYVKYFSVNPSTIRFDAFTLPQFFIFNVAVGGKWPGYPDATTTFPQTMIVDYVRIFQ